MKILVLVFRLMDKDYSFAGPEQIETVRCGIAILVISCLASFGLELL